MSDRPPMSEGWLRAWLEDGPTTGPDDGLSNALARTRSTRQRPGWLAGIRGDPMESTWRARPMPPGRLGLALLTTLLIALLAAAVLVTGSSLLRTTDRHQNAVPPAIPQGGEALLAFASYTADQGGGDIHVVGADGTGGRRITADPAWDTSPEWSPDGSRLAFYSGRDGGVMVRLADPDGTVRVLADADGCLNGANALTWSPDGRFVAYNLDRAGETDCESATGDVYVAPVDGSVPGRRLLAADQTMYTTSPHWVGDRIVMRGNDATGTKLIVVTVTDPAQPWDLEPQRVDSGSPDLMSYEGSRLSPDASRIATRYVPDGSAFGSAITMGVDGGPATGLLDHPLKDQVGPAWAPDGTRLTVLELTKLLSDHGIYHLVVVGPDGSDARTIDSVALSANGGPAVVSPDGTRAAARVDLVSSATPGGILFLSLDGPPNPVEVPAQAWSGVSWQPVANPDNPAAHAPEGLPQF